MRLRTLALLVILIRIPVARAHSIVWFEAVPITPFTSVGTQGPGQTLQLPYQEAPGTYSWQVSMKTTLGAGGILEWTLDLRTAPGNGVSIINPQTAPGNPFTFHPSPGTPGSGVSLLQTAHGTNFDGVQPQTLTLITFTLRRTVSLGDFSHANILGGPSANSDWVWVNNSTADYEVVQFGPNRPVPALEGTLGTLPLIHLFPFPEPSSLSLLIMGAAVCLRRRRSNVLRQLV